MTDTTAAQPVSGDGAGDPVPEESTRALPTRRFGWRGRCVPPDEDPRRHDVRDGELATLTGSLRDHRGTLELKCQGLDAAQLARRSVPPSTMSLLGLVRHLADVERFWFRTVLAGEEAPPRFSSGENRDQDWDGAVADPEVVAEAWRAWREEVAYAERFVARAPHLEITGDHHGQPVTLRQVLVHMIEEYARHNGHADLLRERIDGRVGV